jgi:prophage DNA circulation protein
MATARNVALLSSSQMPVNPAVYARGGIQITARIASACRNVSSAPKLLALCAVKTRSLGQPSALVAVIAPVDSVRIASDKTLRASTSALAAAIASAMIAASTLFSPNAVFKDAIKSHAPIALPKYSQPQRLVSPSVLLTKTLQVLVPLLKCSLLLSSSLK